MSEKQRRMAITWIELQDLEKTGEFPLMTDPIKKRERPFCGNCKHWKKKDVFSGNCKNEKAWDYGGFGKFSSIKGMITGRSFSCPKYEFPSEKN